MKLYKRARGFTLIELMIVVAIIGVLATLALPSYVAFTTRAKVSEAIVNATKCRTVITEFYASNNVTADYQANAFGCEDAGPNISQYVNSIQTNINGVITIALTGDINSSIPVNSTINFTPYNNTNSPATPAADAGQAIAGWSCTAGSVDPIFLPANCR